MNDHLLQQDFSCVTLGPHIMYMHVLYDMGCVSDSQVCLCKSMFNSSPIKLADLVL